ncbi:MAG: DEAD/DEAH box helicase family protein [Clostridium sp.]|nr:DEAD/DEAH box helicase family protein [Clostridium sp.]
MGVIELYDYQLDAVKNMKNGCILCGGVGSGKSLTALAYYYLQQDGEMASLMGLEEFVPMGDPPDDLYIITTARKRDTCEWEGELSPFLLSPNKEANLYHNKVVIDSWNNISKYKDVTGAFFIFDEQRVVGSGAWVKSFLKIARGNKWILLSATPGDTWQDYIPVFIANGFYKNRTEFIREHIVYSRFSKYPKVDKYLNTGRLIRLRNSILVNMDFKRQTVSHHEDVFVKYDISEYKDVSRTRWNPYKNEPIMNAGELCYVWRQIVNTSEDRQIKLLEIVEKHPRSIIFYNFDYELELLKELFIPQSQDTALFTFAEWNGHAHQPIPDTKYWVYLVQYNAGAEGWNCIKTDTIIFYSQNYSYKVMTQAAGRIDRLNTPYTDLYYYHLKSRSGIDLAISQALREKKNFNEGKFVKW